MEWKDIARKVIQIGAPLAGTILTGGSAPIVGTLISQILGVANRPDAVMAELKNNPEAVLKLKQFETEKAVKLEELAVASEKHRLAEESNRLETVNVTMRAETKSEDPWTRRWRPFWGYISAVAFLMVVIFVGVLGWKAIAQGKPEAMLMIPQLITAFAALFTTPLAILGISAWHRGRKQRVEAGEQTLPGPGLLQALANRIDKQGRD